jgi:preprotein translocase subunit SecE
MAEPEVQTTKPINPIVRYFRETRAELTKVSWPTREEWLRLSGIVLLVTFVMSIILGAAEALGAEIMSLLLRL